MLQCIKFILYTLHFGQYRCQALNALEKSGFLYVEKINYDMSDIDTFLFMVLLEIVMFG